MTPEELVSGAHSLLSDGRREEAIAACRQALALEPDFLPAHVCMARAKLPGEDFLAHLARFHEWLRPPVYLEIGVDAGRTLSLARPPTRAIGVDPALAAHTQGAPFAAPTSLCAVDSDSFFASGQAARELAGLPIGLAFVDGLHLFEQALKDFMHIERHAAPDSLVLFHDCLPLDEPTSRRVRATGFWTGDVWKIAPILARFRPDVTVFLIPAYPTGLLAVTRLDPSSRALEERFGQIVAEYAPRSWSEPPGAPPLPLISNDWAAISSRIPARRS